MNHAAWVGWRVGEGGRGEDMIGEEGREGGRKGGEGRGE